MKPILLILLLLCSHIAFSQGVVVSADKMNVFYVGIDNPITIAADNYPCKDLIVEISQGTIIKDEDNFCRYIANVTTPGKATVTVKNNKGKLLGVVEFRVHRLPDPIAKIGGMNGGVTSKNKFKVQLGLYAELLGFDINITYKTISYEVIAINKQKNTLFHESNKGILFNERVKERIMNVEDDDMFIFDNIKVVGPDEIIRELSPITFRFNDTTK